MAITLLSVLTLLGGTSSSDVSLRLDELLARHNAAVARLSRCTVTTQERWLMTKADATPEQIFSVRKCNIRLDNGRANLLVNEVNYPPGVTESEAGTTGNANEFNYVCSDQVLEIFYPHEKFDVRPDSPSGVTGRLSRQTDDEYYAQNAAGNAAIAFGLSSFLSPIPIPKLISMSKNAPLARDEIGYRVEGTAPDGTKHTIWFDPNCSFMIKALKFEQSGETLNDNRYQYNRRVLKSRYGFEEKALVNSVVFEIKGVQIEPLKDTHVITRLETTKTITAVDGAKAVERTIHSLTDWNLDPDFSDKSSFQPWLPVPEGTRVLIQDTPSLGYIYKEGRIQLAINEKTIEELKRVQLPTRPSRPRVQWAWALVAGVLGFVWWRIRARAG